MNNWHEHQAGMKKKKKPGIKKKKNWCVCVCAGAGLVVCATKNEYETHLRLLAKHKWESFHVPEIKLRNSEFFFWAHFFIVSFFFVLANKACACLCVSWSILFGFGFALWGRSEISDGSGSKTTLFAQCTRCTHTHTPTKRLSSFIRSYLFSLASFFGFRRCRLCCHVVHN